MAGRWARWTREPLVVFAGVAAALFAVDAVLSPRVSTEPPESMVRALVGDFEQRVGRAPTPEETEQLKAEWSEAEALYQEGLALGLDRRDPVVRRRVIAKMEALQRARDASIPVDEAELRVFFEANEARYRTPVLVRYSLTSLNERGEPEDRPSPHPTEGRASVERLRAWFGPEVAAAAAAAPTGQATGLQTRQGAVQLTVSERTGGQLPDLSAVRVEVLRDFQAGAAVGVER